MTSTTFARIDDRLNNYVRFTYRIYSLLKGYLPPTGRGKESILTKCRGSGSVVGDSIQMALLLHAAT